VNILMFHSVGEGRGPITIDAGVFQMQLDALAQAGLRGAALRDAVAPAGATATANRDRLAVLTFDDGYRDFAEVAWPEIAKRGWGATVFLSSGLVGSAGGWDPDGRGRSPLIDWREARRLADLGVELGAHAVSHRDLTRLTHQEACHEIETSRAAIEDQTGASVTSFAAPFGRTTPAIRAEISRVYERAVGTRLGRVDDRSDRFDLPRIEMWYFRDPVRWRRHLEGATGYLSIRRTLRRARQLMRHNTGWS
jgi:peptidoglycan/xylan/chitin deacetylase (PgdA/CDA1 family)